MSAPIQTRKYLITGASGYVGGRLVRTLVDEKFDIRIQIFFSSDQDQNNHFQDCFFYISNSYIEFSSVDFKQNYKNKNLGSAFFIVINSTILLKVIFFLILI